MADKTPVRVVFNASNVATGMAEFQSGDTVGTAFGGTGLTSIGSAGQVLKVNAAGNALEFAAEGDISITNLVAPTNADLTFTTSGTGNIVLDAVTVNGTTLSAADSTKITVAEALDVTGALVAATSLNIAGDGATVTGIKDEDNMASDSATKLATQQSIKAYVDSQLTASDLDFQADSGGALSIDLDSETITFTGGTGIDTSGSGNAVTFAIDSTVTTLTGSQTLTNKTLTSPTINDATINGGTFSGTFTGDINPGTVTTNNIVSNGSNADITIDPTGTGDINLTAGADVNIPANIGVTFGDDGEKIEGDGTNLTISSSNTTTVDSTNSIFLKTAQTINFRKSSVDYGQISESSSDFVITAGVQDKDILFKGDDNGGAITALTLDMSEAGAATFNSTVTVGGAMTATSVTANDFTSNGSNADITVAPQGTGDINLTAGADVNIPANIGVTYGNDGEKIEGDGTRLTVSSSAELRLDSSSGQVDFRDDGTNVGFIGGQGGTDFIIQSAVSDKDIKLRGKDGSSDINALILDMSEAGAATFNDAIILGTNKEIRFVDTNESIKSDGSKIIIKSGGTTFNLPTADGTAGQALVTDGSGTLSFDSVATTVSDDTLATVRNNKSLSTAARTIDSINATFIDSAFYFLVHNDLVNEVISAEMIALTNNDSASFIGNRRGIESAGGTTVPTLTTDVSNGQFRLRATGTSADCKASFYKVAMSSSTTDATRGNTVTTSNTDVDSASESIDTFAHASFRGAKYFISVDNDSKTEMDVVEALVVHDGSDAFISSYGHVTSGGDPLITLTAAISGSDVVVSAAGLEPNLNLTIHKILLKDDMTAESNANQKAFAAVTVSSTATAIDLMDLDDGNGAVYFIVGKNATEGHYSIQEVYTAATPGVPAVASGPFVSTKGTTQLEFTAEFDTASENSLELFASSTSGGSTTVSGYRISALAG